MGYLVKRAFLNKSIKNDYFIDVCITHRNERLLWYCQKEDYRMMYGICLDEKMQDDFFKKINSDYTDDDFEEKVQVYFNIFSKADYGKIMRSFFSEIKVCVRSNTYEIIDNGSGIAVEDSERFKDYEWKRILVYPHLIHEYPKIFALDPDKFQFMDYLN